MNEYVPSPIHTPTPTPNAGGSPHTLKCVIKLWRTRIGVSQSSLKLLWWLCIYSGGQTWQSLRDLMLKPAVHWMDPYLHLLRPGTPVLGVIFNKYLIFEFSTGNSFLLLGLNPLRAKFFRENINIYFHSMSFLHTNKTNVVEIPPRVRQGPAYST